MRVSSNSTLFFKLFLPVGWTVFFSALTIALYFADEETLPFLTSPYFKYPFTAIFLTFLFFIYNSVFKLLRLEMFSDHYIVSDYFKSYRMIYDDIEKITIIPLGRIAWVTYHLKGSGSLGSKLRFLRSRNLFRLFCEANPEVAKVLEGKV